MRWSRAVVITVITLAVLAGIHISISKSLKRREKVSQDFSTSAPGRKLEQWQRAFNAGDAAAYRTFAAENFAPTQLAGRTPEEAAAEDMRFREQVGGGFEVLKLFRSSPHEISVLAREQSGLGYAIITLRLDGSAAEKIARLDFKATPPPPDAAPQRLAEQALFADVALLTDRLAKEDRFSGVVVIAKDGAPVFVKEYGFADKSAQQPVRRDLPFNLGSMNKMFTAVAIAQLVQQGKLTYQSTIAQVLPEYPHKEIAGAITVEQLLTHTSGLGDIFGIEFEQKKETLRELRDYLPLFSAKQLSFIPGEKLQYSNAGYIVLGLIIEKLTGQSYYNYVQANIYDPAGMTTAGSWPRDTALPERAVGYTRLRGEGQSARERLPNTELLPLRGTSAGGGYASALDLLKFAGALRANKLVNEQQTQALLTSRSDSPTGGKYGYGFSIKDVAEKKVVGHGGGFPGVNGVLSIYWDSPYTVIVLSNYDPPIAEQVNEYIAQRIQP